jgi:hypothetical protein
MPSFDVTDPAVWGVWGDTIGMSITSPGFLSVSRGFASGGDPIRVVSFTADVSDFSARVKKVFSPSTADTEGGTTWLRPMLLSGGDRVIWIIPCVGSFPTGIKGVFAATYSMPRVSRCSSKENNTA